MNLSKRQTKIIDIVNDREPISSNSIADHLGVSRAAIRTDLSVLTVLNILKAKPNVGYFINKEDNYRDLNELKDLTVSQFMEEAVTIREGLSIYDTIVKMFMGDAGTVFVTDDNNNLSGVVSRKDLLKMSIGSNDLKKTPVSLAMTRMPNIIFLNPGTGFLESVKKIYTNKVDSLPVLDEGVVVGKVSKTTIINTLINFQEEEYNEERAGT